MDDQNPNQPFRQPQPEQQPPQQLPPQPVVSETPEPVVFVPDEYEPATNPQQVPASAPTQPFVASPSATDTQIAQSYEFTPPVPPKRKKGPIIALISAIVLVVFIGVGAAAYQLWYQNPDKVIADAVLGAFKAETVKGSGNFSYESKSGKFTVKLTNTNTRDLGQVSADMTVDLTEQNMQFGLKGEGMYGKDGDLYLKVTNLESSYTKLVDTYVNAIAKQYEAYGMTLTPDMKKQVTDSFDAKVRPIVEKLDNQWVKISADELKSFNKDVGDAQACSTEAWNMLRDDAAVGREIGDIYKQNKFITVKEKLGTKDGSMGYKLDYDAETSKQFGDAFDGTALGKKLKSCDGSSDSSDATKSDTSTNSLKDTNAEVWVSQWSHQLTKVSFSGTSADDATEKFSMMYEPTFNTPVSIEAPKDFITIDQLQNDLKAVGQSSLL